MKTYNKSRFLAAAIAGLLTVSAFAVDFNDGTFTYTTSTTNIGVTATVTGLVNPNAAVSNPTIGPTVTYGGTDYKVTNVSANAFQNNTNITGTLTLYISATGASSTNQIGANAFAGTGISSLEFHAISQTGGAIGNIALMSPTSFNNCTGLTEVVLAANANATFATGSYFTGCTNITKVVYLGNYTTRMNSFPFPASIQSTATLYVPENNKSAIEADTFGWAKFGTIMTAESLCTGLSITPDEMVLTEWGKSEKFPITVEVTPSYLSSIVTGNINQGSSIPAGQLGTFIGSEFPYTSFYVTNNYASTDSSFNGKLPAMVPLTLSVGDYSATINVYLGGKTTEDSYIDLSFQLGGNELRNGLVVTFPILASDPIDVELLQYPGFTWRSLTKYVGASETGTTLTKPYGTSYQYTETSPMSDNTLLWVLTNWNNASGPTTGVNTIVEDNADAPAQYYNLQGIRVDNPTAPGFYIRRQGNQSQKIVIR